MVELRVKVPTMKRWRRTPRLGECKGWHNGDPAIGDTVEVPVMKRLGENHKLGGHRGWHKGDSEVECRVKEPVMKRWRRTPVGQ